MTNQRTMQPGLETLSTSRHPGAIAVRGFLRIALIAAVPLGISVVLNALAPETPSTAWTNGVLIPMMIGLITGLVAFVRLAGSWSDIVAYARTRGAAGRVIGVLLLLAGLGVLFVLVPVL